MATWNVDRKKGGTYEFEIDAQGNYQLKKSGFGDVKTLNLPELKAEATKATTQDATQDVAKLSAQTKEAFGDVRPFYYGSNRGADNQYTTEYKMTKDKSLDTSQPMIAGDTFAQARQKMTTDEAYRGVTPSDRQPGFEVANKGITKQDTIPEWAKGVDKRGYENINKDISVKATDQIGRQNVDQVLDARAQVDRFGTGQWGPKPSKGMPTTRDLRIPDRISSPLRPSVEKPTVSETALKQINTASNTLSKTLGGFLKGGGIVGGVVRSIAGPPTATQTHAKGYFNVREDGRIAGNASTDLYAGMNRVSAFGNLEKAGAKRISTREKTAAKNVGKWSKEKMDKFNATTNNMKNQQDSYVRDKHEAVAKDAVKKGADPMNPSEMRAASKKASNEKGNSGNGGKSIVCTAMYQTTGLQDWAKAMKIWYIYQKRYLTIQHQEGYHKLFKPFVKGMYKSNIIKAIGAHVAKHRTQHLKHIMFNSKPSLLGKIYNKILEPICYWVGKI